MMLMAAFRASGMYIMSIIVPSRMGQMNFSPRTAE